jgi:formylglycine-generating enzyme required for sulfatase activity
MNNGMWLRTAMAAAAFVLGVSLAHAQGDELLVTDVHAFPVPATGSVYVIYSLETVGDMPVAVSLFLSTDGGDSYPFQCQSVTGDVGAAVLPGASHVIVWNAEVDIPGIINDNCRLRVTADDGILDNFVYVAPGTFTMGSPTDEPGRDYWETQHEVALTHGLYVQTTEVTNQEYMELAQWAYDQGHVTVIDGSYCPYLQDNLDGSTQLLRYLGFEDVEISFSAGVFSCINPDHPVKYVNWYGSVAYCDWLSLQQGLTRAYNHATWQCNGGNPYTAAGYRLPTEAEWEYACRAGTQTPFSTGPCLNAGTEANYNGTDPYTGCPAGPYVGWTVPVGSYPANPFGLYDMHGNVWELCNDWWGDYGGTVTDPVGPGAGSSRVVRGGDWWRDAQGCRSAIRSGSNPSGAGDIVGFRAVRSSNWVRQAKVGHD